MPTVSRRSTIRTSPPRPKSRSPGDPADITSPPSHREATIEARRTDDRRIVSVVEPGPAAMWEHMVDDEWIEGRRWGGSTGDDPLDVRDDRRIVRRDDAIAGFLAMDISRCPPDRRERARGSSRGDARIITCDGVNVGDDQWIVG
ncbi:MAG TPA: hypothetical protein VGF28_07490 [Thermoanaerobaculia bacterium]